MVSVIIFLVMLRVSLPKVLKLTVFILNVVVQLLSIVVIFFWPNSELSIIRLFYDASENKLACLLKESGAGERPSGAA
jgi:hypothetical protein